MFGGVGGKERLIWGDGEHFGRFQEWRYSGVLVICKEVGYVEDEGLEYVVVGLFWLPAELKPGAGFLPLEPRPCPGR